MKLGGKQHPRRLLPFNPFVLLIVLKFSTIQCAPVTPLLSRDVDVNAHIGTTKDASFGRANIKSVIPPLSSTTTALSTFDRPPTVIPRISEATQNNARNPPTVIQNETNAIERNTNESIVPVAKRNGTDSLSMAQDDEGREETLSTKTMNGPMMMKRLHKGVSFIIPRKRKMAPLEPGTIATNITVLNSKISIVHHPAFPKGELFCYIQGVCRLGDGQYLFPTWMKQHSDKLAGCGITNVLYVLDEGESRNLTDVDENGLLRTVVYLKDFPRNKVIVSDEFRNMDILGGDPPRSDWHQLFADLTPRILLADMFLRSETYKKTTNTTCFKQNGLNCNTTDIFPRSLNVSLLVDVGISSVKDHKWPKGVIRLLRNGFEGSLLITDLADIYGFRFRNHASCFRSVLTTNATLPSFNNTHAMVADNFMFRANALSREPVLNLPKMDGRRCDLKVLVLDRIEQGRILGLNALKRALSMLNVRLSKRFPTASVLAEAVYFQNISFHEQISVMQEADIVVASHSELNANVPFLRPNASFFEILPFGLMPEYRALANAYDVRYFYTNAMPDSEMFERCIVHYNDGIDEERDYLLNLWKNEVTKYHNTTMMQNSTRESTFYLPADNEEESMGELRNIRKCASLQRVSANVKQLATSIFKVAMEKCGIRSELAHKQVFF